MDAGPLNKGLDGEDTGARFVLEDCGDGILDFGEQCDDDGLDLGDGCSEFCQIEQGWFCYGVPSHCEQYPDVSVMGREVAEGEDLVFDIFLERMVSIPLIIKWEVVIREFEPGIATIDDLRRLSGTATVAAGSSGGLFTIGTVQDYDDEDKGIEPFEAVQVDWMLVAPVRKMGTATGTIGPPRLVDEAGGAVVRYFFDEQEEGEPQEVILDALTDPVHVSAIVDDKGPAYSVRANRFGIVGRGLAWSASDGSGLLETAIQDTKIQARLDGRRMFTIEALMDLEKASAAVLCLGAPNDSNRLLLYLYDEPVSDVRLSPFSTFFDKEVPTRTEHPVLVTVAYDGEADSQAEAVLYFDGEPVSTSQAVVRSLEIGTEQPTMVLGNVVEGGASLPGWIGYFALYDQALTPAEVKRNAHRILVLDDHRRSERRIVP